jgi:hypothetical protein
MIAIASLNVCFSYKVIFIKIMTLTARKNKQNK